MKTEEHNQKQSTKLAHVLRHNEEYERELGGWIPIQTISSREPLTDIEIQDLVATDTKGRFELNEDKTKVRALYGHSVPVDLQLQECTPPAILYHGTYLGASISVIDDGLIPRSRKYVHLSDNVETAIQTGARHGSPLIVEIDTKKMIEDRYKFFNPTNNVWLVSNVPSRYFKQYYEPRSNSSNEMANCVRHKFCRLVCDSQALINELKNSRIISDTCDIQYYTKSSLGIKSLEDYFYHPINIIVNSDNTFTSELFGKIPQLREYTSDILVISNVESPESSFVKINSTREIKNIVQSICRLVSNAASMHIDFNDIRTALFRTDGEIKILQVHSGIDWDKQLPIIKEAFAHSMTCLMHITTADEYTHEPLEMQSEIINCANKITSIAENVNFILGHSSHDESCNSEEFLITLFIN